MPKRTKYVKGGPLKQTFKTNVADLNVYFDKGAYSADIGTNRVRAGVQGSGLKPPSVIKGSADYKGFEELRRCRRICKCKNDMVAIYG